MKLLFQPNVLLFFGGLWLGSLGVACPITAFENTGASSLWTRLLGSSETRITNVLALSKYMIDRRADMISAVSIDSSESLGGFEYYIFFRGSEPTSTEKKSMGLKSSAPSDSIKKIVPSFLLSTDDSSSLVLTKNELLTESLHQINMLHRPTPWFDLQGNHKVSQVVHFFFLGEATVEGDTFDSRFLERNSQELARGLANQKPRMMHKVTSGTPLLTSLDAFVLRELESEF